MFKIHLNSVRKYFHLLQSCNNETKQIQDECEHYLNWKHNISIFGCQSNRINKLLDNYNAVFSNWEYKKASEEIFNEFLFGCLIKWYSFDETPTLTVISYVS